MESNAVVVESNACCLILQDDSWKEAVKQLNAEIDLKVERVDMESLKQHLDGRWVGTVLVVLSHNIVKL